MVNEKNKATESKIITEREGIYRKLPLLEAISVRQFWHFHKIKYEIALKYSHKIGDKVSIIQFF